MPAGKISGRGSKKTKQLYFFVAEIFLSMSSSSEKHLVCVAILCIFMVIYELATTPVICYLSVGLNYTVR